MIHQHPTNHPVAAQWQRCSSLPAPSVGHHHSDRAHTLNPTRLSRSVLMFAYHHRGALPSLMKTHEPWSSTTLAVGNYIVTTNSQLVM
jgi:hypothetical protein